MLSDVIKIRRGIFTHLDCSQRLLDCAGEPLVRSVDAGLLVGGRTNLGKDKLIVVDKGLLNAKLLNLCFTHITLPGSWVRISRK